jgi:acyl-CoA reductase-like NAD-dependent aldehyde dehydrogenase
LDTLNPSDEKLIAKVAACDKADVDVAVKAARAAFDHPSWSKLSGQQRGALLYKLADVVEKHKVCLLCVFSLFLK